MKILNTHILVKTYIQTFSFEISTLLSIFLYVIFFSVQVQVHVMCIWQIFCWPLFYIQKNKINTSIYQNGDLNSSCCSGDSCILTICSGYKELVKLFCLKVQCILGEYTTSWIHSECETIWSLCVGIYDNILDVWYCISICSLKLEHCIHRKSTDKINMNMLLINNSSSITEIPIINSTAFIVMYMHMYEIIHHYNIIQYTSIYHSVHSSL